MKVLFLRISTKGAVKLLVRNFIRCVYLLGLTWLLTVEVFAETDTPEIAAISEQLKLMRAALARYSRIADDSGWPTTPVDQSFQQGDDHPSIILLKKRLQISGDLKSKAAESTIFSSQVTQAVKTPWLKSRRSCGKRNA